MHKVLLRKYLVSTVTLIIFSYHSSTFKSIINLFELFIAFIANVLIYFNTFVFILFKLFIYLVVELYIFFILHRFSPKSLSLSCGPLEILHPVLKMSELVHLDRSGALSLICCLSPQVWTKHSSGCGQHSGPGPLSGAGQHRSAGGQ